MILNSLVKRVKLYSHRGDQSVTTDQTTSDIIMAINDTRRELVRRVPKRFFWKSATTPLSTSAGDYTYDLASDVQEPIRFFYTTGGADYQLTRVDSDAEWYDSVYSSTAPQGKPLRYRETNNAGTKAIEVAPTPDATYTINYEYYKNVPTELTTSDLASEIPDIPDYLHDALWKGALAKFLKSFDDPGEASAKADYALAVHEFDDAEEKDQDTDLCLRWPGRKPSNTYEGF